MSQHGARVKRVFSVLLDSLLPPGVTTVDIAVVCCAQNVAREICRLLNTESLNLYVFVKYVLTS